MASFFPIKNSDADLLDEANASFDTAPGHAAAQTAAHAKAFAAHLLKDMLSFWAPVIQTSSWSRRRNKR